MMHIYYPFKLHQIEYVITTVNRSHNDENANRAIIAYLSSSELWFCRTFRGLGINHAIEIAMTL